MKDRDGLMVKREYRIYLIELIIFELVWLILTIKIFSKHLIIMCVINCVGVILLTSILIHRIKSINTIFVERLSETIEDMADSKWDLKFIADEDTLFSKVDYKLQRLYNMIKFERLWLNQDKLNLQSLISDVSHQVKTPSTNLKIAINNLRFKELSTQSKVEYMDIIEGQINKIEFLLDALIKTSRLETGVIQLNIKNNSIYETIAGAVGNVFLNAKDNGIEIDIKCSEELYIPHDKRWTTEAIYNILDNGIKYSNKDGKIKIRVERWEKYTKIDIIDHGIGINELSHGKIFQRFYREENAKEIDGVGIGLYLSREIISKQGGYIKLNSELGKGSTFSIYLLNDI